eukprot:scaffold8229_cov239-Pinguiococcus_pyrenoidosus.AAC.3
MAQPRVVYAVVARQQTPLAEATLEGAQPHTTRTILSKLGETARGAELMDFGHSYHYFIDGVFTYMCILDGESAAAGPSRTLGTAFIEDMRAAFVQAIGHETGEQAQAFELTNSFGPVIRACMKQHNSAKDSLHVVRSTINDVRERMIDSIGMVVERGEKMESLLDKTEVLQGSALNFQQSSTRLRREMYWRKVKMYIAAGLVVSVLVIIIVAWGCDGFGKNSRC